MRPSQSCMQLMLEQLQRVLDCTFKAFACPKFSKSDSAISPFNDVSDNCQFSMVAVLVVFSNDGNISYVRVRHLLPSWLMMTLL